ncbi:MAG: hypothetical protein ACOCXQ_01715 [Patescibacteria group bacterium]
MLYLVSILSFCSALILYIASWRRRNTFWRKGGSGKNGRAVPRRPICLIVFGILLSLLASGFSYALAVSDMVAMYTSGFIFIIGALILSNDIYQRVLSSKQIGLHLEDAFIIPRGMALMLWASAIAISELWLKAVGV